MAEETETRRYTVWTVILMLVWTLLAVGIGYVGFGLYLTNMMTFSSELSAEPTNHAAWAAFLYLSAGPFAAGAGLILGWLSFIFFRAPRTGVKLVFFFPIIWAVGVLVFLAVVSTVCQGEFTCGM